MGCFRRSKVSGQHECDPSCSVNAEIVCVEPKSNKGQDATQHVFILEETAYSYNAQHNRALAVNRVARSRVMGEACCAEQG